MPRDKAVSHEKIKEVAKAEFLKNGFLGASMREIGRKCGLSQAAIYKHFSSKEDMFISLIEPLLEEIKRLAEEHESLAYKSFNEGVSKAYMESSNAIMIMRKLIPNYKAELKLLLAKAQGTKYEFFIHDYVISEQEGTMKALGYLKSKGMPVMDIDIDELHIILSSYLTAICETVIHEWDDEKIYKSLDLVSEFFIPGFMKLFGL